ncbi:uncharacterized protein LOC127738071 [Mytilus californianus]|uniref:uncharacterized protein LOC127738071 n=1 Tax=Mytilus californianus TaxID=6549 RepID=UPI0022455643|nr:uncharacterized protein LOC127738071 [Mytilus californianus]
MVTSTGKVTLLVVFMTSVARSMDLNKTMCSEECAGYNFPSPPSNRDVINLGIQVDVSSSTFIQNHLWSFPCPPAWWPGFCTDLQSISTVNFSCQEITILLEVCLKQTEEKFYINLLSDCKIHLHCKEFKRLCSSEKYWHYCVDGTTHSVTNSVKEDNAKTHMNNTTEITMGNSVIDSGVSYIGPNNWHVLWALLVLVYIFVFVPCFLNFVIKRSLIEKIRNRCQRGRTKTLKTNCDDDEPPLIPAVHKELHSPVDAENSLFIPSRPDSMTSSIGHEFDFPYADQSAAVSMYSLLIDDQDSR